MSEFSDVLKVIIEKGGFKTLLASTLGAILFYKLILDDWLWSVVVFCGCYLLCNLAVWAWLSVKKKIKSIIYEESQILAGQAEKDNQCRKMNIVYSSLPKTAQQQLIELYKLPPQDFFNVRILNNMPYQQPILEVCYKMLDKYQLIGIEEGLGSFIITIDSEFYKILEKHATDFE